MSDIFDKIYQKAKKDQSFAQKLAKAYRSDEPLVNFCTICTQNGLKITVGDVLTLGEEYSCNQLKSTNGGGVNPYDYYDDPYETLMSEILRLLK